ncbi:tannase and feruloyl esterase [Mycena crocata]|nr:tannase and feruloyl esterase [Mycena crocata]
MVHLLPFVAPLALIPLWTRTGARSKCLALQRTLEAENTASLNVTCQSTAPATSAPLCSLQFIVNTTSTSAYGRFLATGNGGLGGCVDYPAMDYGASLHIATFGIDNGHDGNTGVPFLNHPEVINDFAWPYYGAPAVRSYWLGCSTGARQETQAALKFPNDFDGILAGAPAVDWNHLIPWLGLNSLHVGGVAAADEAPPANDAASNPNFISSDLWAICDALDVVDGVITEPDHCNFRFETLACTEKQTTNWASKIYSPLLDALGKLLYPRFSPGAEADPTALSRVFTGSMFQYSALFTLADLFSDFGLRDTNQWNEINAGDDSTFDGESAFRGKFLTYHGRRDPLIPGTNSKRVYDLIASTPEMHSLDAFYRLFLIPGMGHCSGDIGTVFGQGKAGTVPPVNASSHNILLALVDWVESGKAPSSITSSGANGTERMHCLYPMRSVGEKEEYVGFCV